MTAERRAAADAARASGARNFSPAYVDASIRRSAGSFSDITQGTFQWIMENVASEQFFVNVNLATMIEKEHLSSNQDYLRIRRRVSRVFKDLPLENFSYPEIIFRQRFYSALTKKGLHSLYAHVIPCDSKSNAFGWFNSILKTLHLSLMKINSFRPNSCSFTAVYSYSCLSIKKKKKNN